MKTFPDDFERDPEERSAIRPLDIFLLAVVRAGLITPYDWQSRARISLGASLPATRRLLKLGLLKKSAIGPRGRHEFALTSKGLEKLKTDNLRRYLDEALDQQVGNVESVIRLACLATIIRDVDTAKKFLRAASDFHRRRAQAAKGKTFVGPFVSNLGGLYSMVMNDFEIEQEDAIADQLESLRRRWGTVTEEILEFGSKRRKTGR